MKRPISIGLLITALALLGLVLAQGMMGPSQSPNNTQRMNQGYGTGMVRHGYGFDHGMMNQGHGFSHGMYGQPNQDMMQGNMMNGMGMMQGNMMGMMQRYPASAEPVTRDTAEARFEEVAKSLGSDLQVHDVMVFSNNYYAQIVDEQGQGVAEILVDRYTGVAYPEPGPNMMWNTRNGMMGFGLSSQARFDESAAQTLAERFLGNYLPEASIQAGQAFNGYYTFDYGRSSNEGMLSVNAYTGEIWVHTWHGNNLGD